MEAIADELVALLNYIQIETPPPKKSEKYGGWVVRKPPGLEISNAYSKRSGISYQMVKDFEDIVTRLYSSKSRVGPLRDKLEEFKKKAFLVDASYKGNPGGIGYSVFKTKFSPEGFQEYLKSKVVSDEMKDLTSTLEKVSLTSEEERQKAMKPKVRTPPPSPHDSDSEGEEEVENQRIKAMFQPKIVEDRSNIFQTGDLTIKKPALDLIETTGIGVHANYGERHSKAKLTNEKATEIRRRVWVNKEKQNALAKEYGVAEPTINNVISRESWSHLPQVEGEPDDVFKSPNSTEKNVIALAKKLGIEPIRNKIGRLSLPPEVVLQMRMKKKDAKE